MCLNLGHLYEAKSLCNSIYTYVCSDWKNKKHRISGIVCDRITFDALNLKCQDAGVSPSYDTFRSGIGLSAPN